MRDFIDEILAFIGSTSLTDEEFDGITATEEAYNVATYRACKEVLESRESVSDTLYRLAFFFLAKGVTVATVNTSQPSETGVTPKTPTSEIFIGGVL